MLAPDVIRRRIRAARDLAGVTVDELADRVAEDGLGAKTLGNIERGTRPVRPMELRAIAAALELPDEFFLLTPEEFSERLSGERVRRLEQALEELERRRQEDLAAIASELAAQVSLALETGALPSNEGSASTANRGAAG